MASPLVYQIAHHSDVLDAEHVRTFDHALVNLLRTPCAESAFSQLLEGLPTEASMRQSFWYLKSHPVYQLNHCEVSDESRSKFEDFRSHLDKSRLQLDPLVSICTIRNAYQKLKLVVTHTIPSHRTWIESFQFTTGGDDRHCRSSNRCPSVFSRRRDI